MFHSVLKLRSKLSSIDSPPLLVHLGSPTIGILVGYFRYNLTTGRYISTRIMDKYEEYSELGKPHSDGTNYALWSI